MSGTIYDQERLDFDAIAELSSELLIGGVRPAKMQDAMSRYFEARAAMSESDGHHDIAAQWRERAERHRKLAVEAEERGL